MALVEPSSSVYSPSRIRNLTRMVWEDPVKPVGQLRGWETSLYISRMSQLLLRCPIQECSRYIDRV